MAEVKKDSSLGDSCGSDGSLSKDLSHQAELNFVSQGVNLAFEDEILLESSELPQGEKYENENVVEFARPSSVDLSKEMEIAAKYIEATEMSDAMEQDCDSDDALMFCENCKGPITKMKKFDNTGKQFCSKQCADGQNKAQNLNEEKAENIVANRGMSPQLMTDLQDVLGNNQFGPKTSSPSGKETEEKERNNSLPPDFDWRKYRNMLVDQAAPASCFGKLSKGVKGLKPGMKLEALDKNDPCNYCIATVIDVMGHRVRIRYDGFGNDDSRDFWCNFQAEELFPIGWCAENSYPLQPPAGITSTLEDWKTFLTKTLTGALAAPMDLFKENENRSQPNVHSFQAGARVECIHPTRPSIICPGTVSRILGPYGYEITTEPLPHLPAHVFYGNTESTGIFEFGWTMKNGIDLALPAYVDGSGLSKDKYIASCKSRSAPPLDLYKKTTNNFKIDQKLEAVDLEEPSVIRVATVFNIVGRVLHLLFDGQRKFQYVDCESDDIYPIDWCMKTGHPLSTPYGLVYPTMADIAVEPEQMNEEAVNNGRSMTLPSFQNVLKKEEVNKKIRAKLDGSILSPSNENASQLSKDPERKTEEQDKVEETHCVFFNKSCLIGPYLDPEKVANMPEFTAFGKPPAAIKFALEHVIEATITPMDAMDAIQEGFCPKLFSKGKRKILKKGLFRFDTKLRAGRFLKRLCKKLKSCEYFLSFDPAKDPCPLECQVSGTTSLESFMAMRGMKAKGTLIVKRGRPRKDEFELQKPESHNIGEFGSSKEDWPANIKHTLGMPVRVMNPTSYHGRPLVPIAPGSKVNQSPVTIVPAGSQLRHLRPPPPYELDGRASLVQSTPTNTTVTSSTQPRMVTPVSLRMFSPTTPTAVLPAGDSSTANFPTQNLATVLVVTNPHSTSQAGPGVFSLRGTVPHHGLRLPSSTNSRKLSVGSRMKSPGPIKIHGPMIDQLPGVMNPMSPKHRLSFPPSQKIDSPVASYHKLQQAIRIPSPQNTSSSSYDKDTKVMLDYDRYRESRNYEHIAPSPGHQFIKIQKKPDIKLEPQEHQHYPGSNNNHNQALPTVRIHHPASSTFHSRPDELQMRSNSVDMLNLIPDRMISDNSHSPSNLTSPARQEFTMTRFEIGPHQNRHSHSQSSRTHMPVGQSQSQVGQNQLRQSQMGQNQISPNHLHVSTSVDDSQSALSPMHSPPPLRPAPSNQHRSIALRSPPNLTPSTVLSHFDFSPVSTNTVISQPGHLYRQQNTQVIDSSNGRLPAIEIKNITSVNHGPKNAPSSTTNMVTFTYIPVQTQANEKLVYVPINQHFNNDRHKHRYQPQQQQQQQQNHQHQQQQQTDQQSVILYSNQRKQNHQFSRPFSDVGSPLPIDQALSDKKIPLSPLDLSPDSNNGPYSGITRKFTVRTLQRAQGPLASSLTTVRLQGPNVTEGDAQNAVDNQTSPFNMSNVKFANRNDGRRLGPMENNFTSVISTVNTPSSERSPSVASRENQADNQSEPNLNYDEVSDYEDDMDYDEFDDGNEANYDDDGVVDESKSPGFRGRKRGKQKFFVRKKGNANHHYKLKYKQALEQAKVMRERRPSFVPSSLHSEGMEHCEKQSPPDNILNQQSKESEKATFVSNDTSAASPTMSENTAEIKPNIESTSYRLEMVGQNNTENPAQYSLSQFSNGFENNVDLNLKEEIVDNTPIGGEAFAPTSGSTTVLQSSPVKKGKVDGKAQRRKRKGNNSFENDFFYGQWTLSQDGSNKKKKRNSTSSSLSPTQYLADPLERVKLPSNPETWSEGQVASFIGATECSQYADTLKDQEIDGSALLLLTRESLMEFTGMKLGPALKICGYVAHLKGRMRMHQNIAVIQS